MSESILNALMHLFAVFAPVRVEGISDTGRNIVQSYLLRYLNKKELIEEYIQLFENYQDFYQRDLAIPQEDIGFQTAALDTENLTRICTQIRKELNRSERIIVLLRLIEFILEDQFVSEREKQFVSLVAETFSITGVELDNAILFLEEEKDEQIPDEYTIYVQAEAPGSLDELEGDWIEKNRPVNEIPDNKIIKPGIEGKIIFLNFKSLNIFVLKYEGYYSEIASRLLQSSQEIRITMNAVDIEFRFKNSENGIRRFSFSEDSGQMIGIMGGSGVGKSTLLFLLSGQLPLTNGQITINDYDLHNDRFKIKGIIGFVPQDDLLFEELTVYQNLYYNARLCFGNYSERQLLDTVNNIITELDLTEIKDLKVGSPLNKFISGGQRKRLNIGLELMREPSVLFIDEPTSGLSSMDAENVIRLLKEQTIKGKLVIANIHQPSSNVFKMFDKLWVIDKGGFPIYSGNPVDAIVYFKKLSSFAEVSEAECGNCGNVNPDQILQIVEAKLVDDGGKYSQERKVAPETWYEHYQENIAKDVAFKEPKKILPATSFRIPDINVQFKVFFLRNLLSKLTNRQYVLLNLVEAPLLAFILAYFTKFAEGDQYLFSENKNLPAYLFMSVIVAIFMGLIVSAEEIIRDRKILQREAFLNLSWFSYINSKIIYLFALSAVQMFLYVLVGNWILEIKGMTFSYWLILFSTAFTANMLGLNISGGMNSIVNIYILIPLILIPQLLLSGVTVKFDDLHKSITSKVYVPAIGDMMASRWAYEALAVEQAKNNRFDRNFYLYDQRKSEAQFMTSFLVPRLLNKLDECNRNLGIDGDQQILEANLDLLYHEVKKLGSHPDIIQFEHEDRLNINDFYGPYALGLQDWLTYVVSEPFKGVSRTTSRENDEALGNLIDSLGSEEVFGSRQEYALDLLSEEELSELIDSLGNEAIIRLKQDYHNNRLAEQVTNYEEVTKILEINGRLVQKGDPIYLIPESNLGRAHFYAPYKRFNNQLTDTKWFNLLVLWGFSFLVYITLLLDLFRKFINYINSLKLRREAS
jgi:ABC-type multidrug transport system ATPase subunit